MSPRSAAPPVIRENDSTIESPAPSSTIPERPEDRFSDLRKQSVDFLENIKCRFREHSQESTTIHNALGDFSVRKMRKAEVYFIIFDLLGSQPDLKQDFQAIFHHEDADWEFQDFERPGPAYSSPPAQISPDFLQPQHQPQLPMPPLTSFWQTGSYIQPTPTPSSSINPDLLYPQVQEGLLDGRFVGGSQTLQQDSNDDGRAYAPLHTEYHSDGHDDMHFAVPENSSPTLLPPFSSFQQHTSPEMNYAEYSDMSYCGHSYAPQVDEAVHEQIGYVLPSFSLKEAWDIAQFENTQHAHHTTNVYEQHRVEASDNVHHEPTPQLMSPQQSSVEATPSVLSAPVVPLRPQPTFVMEPPKRRPKRKAKRNLKEAERADLKILLSLHGATEALPIPKGRKPSAGIHAKGEYVHSLCGKTFATRHAVKKHHWGNRLYDHETVTGCWAKHNKPPVEWNEHSSCKVDAHKFRDPHQSDSQTPQSHFAAPTASMVPTSPNPLPGFPTLQELPQRVAESLTPPYSYVHDDTMPYYDSQLRVRGSRESFDTLLTAVNMASSIESPTPQGRNDSVVSHLDAQVASMELQPQPTAFWTGGHFDPDSAAFDRKYHGLPQLSPIGLGTAPSEQAPVAGMSQARAYGEQQTIRTKADPEVAMPKDVTEMHTSTAAYEDTVSNDSRKRGRRGTRTTGISRKELKGLGLDALSGPERKRVKGLSD
ncbi:hypothetical protein K491DRAFT_682513 [Lophiostoma macrostomum CBS 122681]|uniref:Uncharacterized protein n=1 Tax=Lophiostoma macrostomum CBS 122681 TaxID=1314788 RepID=A0A6A6STY0_9PLEO|nr:hypothetical protein K491DRAFT_682513 [Lophiostoma macrostomum CBS 122681]